MIAHLTGKIIDKNLNTLIIDVAGVGYEVAVSNHRIIMMLAAASLVSEQPVRIHGCRAVAKSYPDFFKVLGRLGFTTKVLSDDD